jgi:hypothetical protein
MKNKESILFFLFDKEYSADTVPIDVGEANIMLNQFIHSKSQNQNTKKSNTKKSNGTFSKLKSQEPIQLKQVPGHTFLYFLEQEHTDSTKRFLFIIFHPYNLVSHYQHVDSHIAYTQVDTIHPKKVENLSCQIVDNTTYFLLRFIINLMNPEEFFIFNMAWFRTTHGNYRFYQNKYFEGMCELLSLGFTFPPALMLTYFNSYSHTDRRKLNFLENTVYEVPLDNTTKYSYSPPQQIAGYGGTRKKIKNKKQRTRRL